MTSVKIRIRESDLARDTSQAAHDLISAKIYNCLNNILRN